MLGSSRRGWRREISPNLAALAAAGSYQPLTPSNPPQTAVAWSSIITGLNPGRTGIMGAVNRQRDAYWPEPALNRVDREAYRVVGFRSQAFGLGLGTALGILLGTVLAIVRRLRRRRPGAVAAARRRSVGGARGIRGRHARRHRGLFLRKPIPAAPTAPLGQPAPGHAHMGDRGCGRHSSAPGPSARQLSCARDRGNQNDLGIGPPDMHGGAPMATLYTTDPSVENGVSPSSVRIVKLQSADAETQLFGPPNDFFFDPERRHIMREEGVPE